MDAFISKYRWYFFGAMLIVASGMIFFNLTRADIQSDDAMYSLRSIGMLDYMDSQLQKSPIWWFETIPGWAHLSFHDAPPLAFLIQHEFFNVFGATAFAAKLPFALAGVGCVILLYFLVKTLSDEKTALLAGTILALMSYHVWASRVGYLEIMALFFSLLTLLCFARALTDDRWWWAFGISLGLSLLVKYTVIFLVPSVIIYLAVTSWKRIASHNVIGAFVLAAILFSPIVYYNVMMYQARGHFDLQFAKLLHQDMSDWKALESDGSGQNIIQLAVSFWQILFSVYSAPFFLLSVLAIVWLLSTAVTKRQNMLLALTIIFLVAELSLVGVAVRFISLVNPFFAAAIAIFIIEVIQLAKNRFGSKSKIVLGAIAVVVIGILGYEAFYSINTNILPKPLGVKSVTYSDSRLENRGYQNLERYLVTREGLTMPTIKPINSFAELKVNFATMETPEIFIYDRDLNWFSTLWYFRRWSIYGGAGLFADADLYNFLKGQNWFDVFKGSGIKDVYYIVGQNRELVGASFDSEKDRELSKLIISNFEKNNADVVEVRNDDGGLAFKVYKLKFN